MASIGSIINLFQFIISKTCYSVNLLVYVPSRSGNKADLFQNGKTKTANDGNTILHIHVHKAHDISIQMALCNKAVFLTAR